MVKKLKSGVSDRVARALSKPSTARGKRYLKSRGELLKENDKTTLFIRGPNSGDAVNGLLRELARLKKPLSIHFTKQETRLVEPFEASGIKRLEELSKRNDASLIVLGSKTKKRPFRLVLARTFGHEILDMQEVDVKSCLLSSHFPQGQAPLLGSKPLVLFQGSGFESSSRLRRVRSLLLDLLRGPSPAAVNLEGIDHAWVVSAIEGEGEDNFTVTLRHYKIAFKKTGTKLPFTAITELGPRLELTVGRERAAEHERWKAATRRNQIHKPIAPTDPEAAAAKKRKFDDKKNVSTDGMGVRKGRIHLGRQEFSKIHTPHGHRLLGKKDKQDKQ